MGIMKNVKDLFYLLISIEVILLITIKVWVMEKWVPWPSRYYTLQGKCLHSEFFCVQKRGKVTLAQNGL